MKNKSNILLVEDDKNLGYVLKDFLEMSGYMVDLAVDGLEGIHKFDANSYDLCILDIMMPYKDGFTLAEEIRKKDVYVPIIFLSAKTMEDDRIRGFKVGADDYVTKPFSTDELKLRVEAILKRSNMSLYGNDKVSIFNIGKYTFDYNNQLLTSPAGERRLTKKESEVLRMLCRHKNKILRRDIALKAIWGEDDYFMGRSMDVYITKLRKFLKEDDDVSIINIHRTGFKLEVSE